MPFIRSAASAAALVLATISGFPEAKAAAADYRFEAVGKPQPSTAGRSVVAVRLVHIPDGKPVSGAIIIQTKADMGPAGMVDMTAPVQALPAKEPGTYQFEIQPGMAGKWSLTLGAKVQGEAETVRGAVTIELSK
jgi:YtkA-like